MTDPLERELAGLVASQDESPDDPLLRRRVATVTAVTAGPSYTVSLGGMSLTKVRSLVPLVAGDVVTVIFDGPRPLITSHADSGWHEIGAAGEPAFQNSWSNYGAGWRTARFRRVSGITYVSGLVKHVAGDVAGSTVFTLPAGYRPLENMLWPAHSHDATAEKLTRVDVMSNGDIIAGSALTSAQTYFSLSGIVFVAEQ